MSERYLVGDRAKKIKPLLVSMYGARCAKCAQPIDLSLHYPDPLNLSIGHQLPLSRGGTDTIDNLRPEHLQCNQQAGNRLDTDGRSHAIDPRFF